MKNLLIFAPQFLPISPPAGMAYLAAYLKQQGSDIIQKDLNSETYNYLLSEKCLNSLKNIIAQRLNDLGDQDDRKATSDLIHQFFRASYLKSRIEEAKGNMKDIETYRRPGKYAWSIKIINDSLNLISCVSGAFNISLSGFCLPGKGQKRDILRFLEDDNLLVNYIKKNIYGYLQEYRPRVIGISVGDNPELPLAIAAIIKRKAPNLFIALGGPGITVLKTIFSKEPEYFDFFDALVLHDGEISMTKLLRSLDPQRELPTIPNLIYRKGRKLYNTSLQLPKISTIPPPSFDGLNLNLYLSPKTIFPLQIGRGCYWNRCTFCDRPIVFSPNHHSPYRVKSIEQIIKEIRFLKKAYRAHFLYFVDEAIPPLYLDKLSHAIINKRIPIKWGGQVRFEEYFQEEMVGRIKKSGCVKLNLGLESGNRRILKLIDKGIGLSAVINMIGWFRKYEIPLHIWLIIGFPTETKQERQQSYRLFSKLVALSDIPGFSFEISKFALDYFSFINQNPKEFGIIKRLKAPKILGHHYRGFTVSGGKNDHQLSDLVEKLKEKIRKRAKNPEFLDMAYITGFLWGMFSAGKRIFREKSMSSLLRPGLGDKINSCLEKDVLFLNTPLPFFNGKKHRFWAYNYDRGRIFALDSNSFKILKNFKGIYSHSDEKRKVT